MSNRVTATPEAAAVLHQMTVEHGEVLLHLSGGCCEGSAPICLRRQDFRVGAADRLLGTIEGCPVYAGEAMADILAPYDLVLDIGTGAVDSFSIEAADGVRFTLRSVPAGPSARPASTSFS